MKDTVDSRAVKIAAKIMQADGLCRHDSVEKCRRVYVDEATCERCIRAWLISKAKKELGWEAAYGIDEMCADSWNWQQKNPDGYGE